MKRLYVKLPEYCRLTGLSPSTVERRIRDGSIACCQPGGRKKQRLFDVSALKNVVNTTGTSSAAVAPTDAEADLVATASPCMSVSPPSVTSQRGPGPKWKRELDALQICTPKSKTE